MHCAFYIARRYLFAHRGVNIITLLSGIAATGIAITTAALVITLSVFNGFKGMVHSLFTQFDPEYKVEVVEGKTVAEDDPVVQAVVQSTAVEAYSMTLSDHALLTRDGRQMVVTIKGVDDNYQRVTGIDGLLYGTGDYCLHADVLDFGIMGIGVASAMGTGAQYEGAIDVYAPLPGDHINMANPAASFRRDELYSPGAVFCVQQAKYDDNLCLTPLTFAQRLFSADGNISAIELKLARGAHREQVERLLDPRFVLKDRYEQQADVFKIMNIEKHLSYAFLTIILALVAFNIISSLTMLIIDKREDIKTLQAIGATDGLVRGIFFLEGWMTCTVGAVIGVAVGVVLCLLQQHYGFVRLGDSSGSFIVDSYPVVLQWTDLALTFVTVLAVSAVAIYFPTRLSAHRRVTSQADQARHEAQG